MWVAAKSTAVLLALVAGGARPLLCFSYEHMRLCFGGTQKPHVIKRCLVWVMENGQRKPPGPGKGSGLELGRQRALPRRSRPRCRPARGPWPMARGHTHNLPGRWGMSPCSVLPPPPHRLSLRELLVLELGIRRGVLFRNSPPPFGKSQT